MSKTGSATKVLVASISLMVLLLPFQNCKELESFSPQLTQLNNDTDAYGYKEIETDLLPPLPASCEIERKCFDVTKFGASNDGETDSLDGIQRAANALVDGGTLYFPAGKYLINQSGKIGPVRGGVQITKKRNIKVMGEGADKSIIIDGFNSGLYPGIDFWVGSFAVRGGRNIQISELGFVSKVGHASDSPSYGGVSNGILVESVDGIKIKNISAENYNYAGVFVTSRHMLTSERCSKEQLGPSKNVEVISSFLTRNRVAGLMLGRAEKILVEKNHFYRNGSPGDGHTGYGSAATSCGMPVDVIVRHNLAQDNVRKGIDFHSGYNLTVHDNEVVGNGLYGIFFSGTNRLGGNIEVYNNKISKMNPKWAQSVHDLDSVKYPRDLRNDPTGSTGNAIYNNVFAIYFYFRGIASDPRDPTKRTPASVKVYNNKVFDFTGANPPNGVEQSYTPIILRARYRTNAVFEIYNNEFDVGAIQSAIGANRVLEQHGRQTLVMRENIFKYSQLKGALIYLSQMKRVDILNNTFINKNSLSRSNDWTDQAFVIDPYSREPYLADPVINTSGNTWIK